MRCSRGGADSYDDRRDRARERPLEWRERSLERVVDLVDARLNRFHDVGLEEARRRLLRGSPTAVRAIDGSFALVAIDGITVRLA
jgi:asparagine synthase (glutamine-hydrolysing)